MRVAIIGDVAGSRFECTLWSDGHYPDVRCLGYDRSRQGDVTGETAGDFLLFHPSCHVTDDSVLTIAIMDWLLHFGDLRTTLRTYFRQAERPELFSKVFRRWASQDTDEPCGSAGNGAAMRVSPVAFAADSQPTVLRLARESGAVTHATEDALAGAEAVALGVFLIRTGFGKREVQEAIARRFGYDLDRPLDAIRRGYRFSSACPDTVPVAFRAFLESASYEETLRRAISVGGDADTMACMAGALAGAFWGIPQELASQVLEMLPEDLGQVVLAFEEQYPDALRIATGDARAR